MISTLSRLLTTCSAALLAAIFVAVQPPTTVFAEPEWWTGEPKELLAAAKQNNKSIVMYFEAKGAEDCDRMEQVTWPALDAEATSGFLWKRCSSSNPKDEAFFKTYQVSSVPEIVVIDGQKRERGRLKGFLAPDLIMGIIDGLPSYDEGASSKVLTFGDGLVFTPEEALAPGFDANQHAYYMNETFDAVNSLAELDKNVFDGYVNPGQSMGIVPGEGSFQTNGLMVTGFYEGKLSGVMNPSVALRIDLSANFDKINMVVGVVEVRFWVQVLALPVEGSHDVFALTVTPKTNKAPTVADVLNRYRKQSRFFPRGNNDSEWKEIVLRSYKPVNMKSDSVWLSFWVNEPSSAFVVDDLRVRLLTEEQAKKSVSDSPDVRRIMEKTDTTKIGHYFQTFDKDKNLLLTKKEFPDWQINVTNIQEKKHGKNFDIWFQERDRNKDGFLDPSEWNN